MTPLNMDRLSELYWASADPAFYDDEDPEENPDYRDCEEYEEYEEFREWEDTK